MAILRSFTVCAALLAGGCNLLREPTPLELTEKRPSIHAMLIANSRVIQAQVRIIGPGRGSDTDAVLIEPVSGARVWLTLPGGERVPLLESPQAARGCLEQTGVGAAPPSVQPGCYSAILAQPIRAGVSYALEVELPGGATAHGNAVAPVAPVVLTPAANARLPVRRLSPQSTLLEVPINWTSGDDAKSHQVFLTNALPYKNGVAQPAAYCYGGGPTPMYTDESLRTDTLRVFTISCLEGSGSNIPSMAWDSIRAQVRVWMYDSVYTRYYKTAFENALPLERASAGITGALGVFGGASAAIVPVTVLPP